MAERTKYQQQMDAERLSPQKADETLSLLLKENEKRNARTEAARSKAFRRNSYLKYAPALICAAAAVVLLVVLQPWNTLTKLSQGSDPGQAAVSDSGVLPQTKIVYGSIAYSGPSVSRGSAAAFEDVFTGVEVADLFPGLQLVDASADAAGGSRQARLLLENEEQTFSAAVSDSENELSLALADIPPAFGGAKFNRYDGHLSAVYQKQGLWIWLDAENMEQSAFEALIERLVQ